MRIKNGKEEKTI